MKIACVIQTMRMGGAQRVFAHMAESWISQGFEVTLFLFAGEEEAYVSYHPKVNTVHLNILGDVNGSIFSRVKKNLKRFPKLRRSIVEEQPDCVLGFMIDENLVTAISMMGLRTPMILVEHSPYFFPIGRFKTWMRDCLYPHASSVVCLTKKAKFSYHPGIVRKSVVIHNPVDVPNELCDLNADSSSRKSGNDTGGTIIGLGRLAKQKRFDRLIRAFLLVKEEYSNWKLVIVGEGDERTNLEKLIEELDLIESASLPGGVSEPWSVLNDADIFAMSSDSEGFPMALMEAMALGKAVVSTDCQTGPAEMIAHGKNGLLVDCDHHSLARGIIQLIESPELRENTGAAAKKIGQKYSIENVMGRYNNIVLSAIESRQRVEV